MTRLDVQCRYPASVNPDGLTGRCRHRGSGHSNLSCRRTASGGCRFGRGAFRPAGIARSGHDLPLQHKHRTTVRSKRHAQGCYTSCQHKGGSHKTREKLLDAHHHHRTEISQMLSIARKSARPCSNPFSQHQQRSSSTIAGNDNDLEHTQHM